MQRALLRSPNDKRFGSKLRNISLRYNVQNAMPISAVPDPEMPESVEFQLDHKNIITATGALWSAFALTNEAPQLAGESVIGKPLLQFISGESSRQMMRTLLEAARRKQAPLELDYRCDSPELRRQMRMRLEPQQDGSVFCSNLLVNSEARVAPIHFVCAKERARDTLVRCSLCNRIKNRERWMEADHLKAARHKLTLKVTYGICPDCAARIEQLCAGAAPTA